ncbi:MAG TPA: tetratricopeptide repeat protein, partial [Candidatus Manganitrophaceae bacterium]|nr:tetratricopeptide repeat protein [Candidatus Manganitrophaceae bacterium]
SLETFIRYNSIEDSVVVGPLMRRTTFEIETLETEGDRGRAVARVRQPNIERVMSDLFDTALSSIGSGMSPGQFDKLLKKRYRSRPVPMVTVKRGVGLVREGEKWKISAGWPQEEQVGALVRQASYLEEAGNLKEAKEKYEAALALNENLIEIQDQIDALDFRLKPAAEAQRESRRMIEQALEDLRRGRNRNGP